ncbi:MAG: hypothetical protein DRI90_21850 [Deltaproteobacteria bacterium]|nr:MAG: hypothetical protein DRI90_21850 [Deltaproteobacteria bacterium]
MKREQSGKADDLRLQALFDATVPEPSQEQLDRMARASARIPEQVGSGVMAWLRARWRPALALGFAGAATLVAALWLGGGWGLGPKPVPPVALTVPTADLAPTTPPPEDDVVLTPDEEAMIADLDITQDDEEQDVVEGDPLAGLDLDEGMADPFGVLDLLFPPNDEPSLDEWSAAYDELLEEG